MEQYGIIGYPLSHSFSPKYFEEKFKALDINADYKPYPIQRISEFPQLLKNTPALKGVNVTIPYKSSVIPLLDHIDPAAKEIGAVNCIKVQPDKTLIGYNTDYIGFKNSLQKLLTPAIKHALVLGTGGAAKAVVYALSNLGISSTLVSSSAAATALSYDQLTPELMQAHLLIINTTPLGMYPNIDNAPKIPYAYLSDHHILYDLIYNPEQTRFLELGAKMNCTIKNGYEMLVLQAEASWLHWTDGALL